MIPVVRSQSYLGQCKVSSVFVLLLVECSGWFFGEPIIGHTRVHLSVSVLVYKVYEWVKRCFCTKSSFQKNDSQRIFLLSVFIAIEWYVII